MLMIWRFVLFLFSMAQLSRFQVYHKARKQGINLIQPNVCFWNIYWRVMKGEVIVLH